LGGDVFHSSVKINILDLNYYKYEELLFIVGKKRLFNMRLYSTNQKASVLIQCSRCKEL